ncbi:hypothetical protein IEQ34_014195 [Dendrobium chrysotoxum]|uniref:THUMP domain-containing protein n=1 Tax=Dendrobium chrysotoxum TaxID=161865 RepID=A0AAV7GLC5_DENCH|nr:hypothetical protein IEQ34_014195 [Dendrobium chrysotoxum]
MAELGIRYERGVEQAIELGLGKENSDQDKKDEDLKPWEQHSAVISIPRYDYKAPSSLLERSHSGFLITCPISETAELANLCPAADENANKRANISLVKLTRSGLLLFTLPVLNYQHVIDTLSSIFRSLGSGNQKPPIWCHRIFPIQETCCLTEKDLHAVVTNLVQRYFSSQQGEPERSIKFAVGYNRRGIEETELRNKKFTSTIALLEKNKCFSVVAGAFKNVVGNSIVDLKSPEVVILVELLPLSGLPPESLMVGHCKILSRHFESNDDLQFFYLC